jgi:hypothetical protein
MLFQGYSTADALRAKLAERGVKKTKRTLRVWRQRREGPPWSRIGKTIIYSDDGFDRWVKSQEQQPPRNRRTA